MRNPPLQSMRFEREPMASALGIAVVCYPGLGGSGVIASELARGLAARGHRVFVLAAAMPSRLRGNGVRFEPLAVPSSPVFDHAPYGVVVANHLIDLVRRETIDVVHLHYAIPHAASALLAAQVLGARAPAMISTLHGTDVTRLGAHPSVHAVTAFALASCDGLTTPSESLRAEAIRCFGLPGDRIEVISNFVDTARFAPPAVRDRGQLAALFGEPATDGPILIHVSNFRPIKRPLDLLDVLARVRRTAPARMVLVGEGPMHGATVARAAELGLGDATRFVGRRSDVEALLGHADGFVLTSDNESFGVAALEAMSSGVPVFGYRVGGVPEVIASGAGTLVPHGDRDALAAAILTGLARRDAMGRAGRARAEALFAGDRVVARYHDYFTRVLAHRRSAA